ncbi:MAG: choice-of-anchor Q domain-containing protein, partial [Pseudomonadota bacterium]
MQRGIYLFWLLAVAPVHAATIAVNTLSDAAVPGDGLCSLREAISVADANSAGVTGCVAQGPFENTDTISLAGLSGTIPVGSTLQIDDNVRLAGPAGGGVTLEGVGSSLRILRLSGGAFILEDLTLRNGRFSAIEVEPATLAVIRRCRFISNTAGSNDGGAIFAGGNNSAIDVSDSYFEGNSAESGGAIYINSTTTSLTVIRSTFTANTASFAGGAVMARLAQNVSITNSTFVGNSAGSSGSALRFGTGNVSPAPTATVSYSTIAANTGAAQIVASDGSSVTIERSILASASNNCNTGTGGTITLDNDSIDDAGTCGGDPGAQVSPLLGVLGDNGGPVPTLGLLTGSPALDRAATCGFVSDDARGAARPSEGDGVPPARCDVGAFEAQGANLFASISGLTGSGLRVQLGGLPAQLVTGNGQVYLGSLLAGDSYSVTVASQPTNPTQICTVTAGSGTVASADVTVAVECVLATFAIGGTVSGLAGSGLSLRLNGQSDLAINSNGSYTFASQIPDQQSYSVAVDDLPTGPDQLCSVSNASGTVSGANVSNVDVDCQTTADLSVTKDDGVTFFTPGEPLTYVIVVRNESASTDVVGAQVLDTVPGELTGASW